MQVTRETVMLSDQCDNDAWEIISTYRYAALVSTKEVELSTYVLFSQQCSQTENHGASQSMDPSQALRWLPQR